MSNGFLPGMVGSLLLHGYVFDKSLKARQLRWAYFISNSLQKQIPKDSLFNHLTPIFQVFLFSLKYTNNSWLILGLTFSGSLETEDFFYFNCYLKWCLYTGIIITLIYFKIDNNLL